MSQPYGSPIRECQTCGERYSEDRVKFYDGICEDCYEADPIVEQTSFFSVIPRSHRGSRSSEKRPLVEV
jgi:hypothetical protein